MLKGTKCNIATVRSGNCIGGGDWTKDRIVKDCAEAFLENKNLFIRIPNALQAMATCNGTAFWIPKIS